MAVMSFLIWVNSYIGHPRIIEKIRQQAIVRANANISILAIKANILDGFKLKNVYVEKHDENAAEADGFKQDHCTNLNIDQIEVRYSLFHLMLRQLNLNKVHFKDSKLKIVQYKDGSWDLPELDPMLKIFTQPSIEMVGQRFALSLDKFRITNGQLAAYHRDEWPIINLHGINLDGEFALQPDGPISSSSITVDRIVLANTFSIRNITGDLQSEHGKLSIDKWQGTAHSGTASGSASLDFTTQPAIYKIALDLDQVDLSKMITELGGAASFIYGRLNLQAGIEGDLRQVSASQGTGSMEIENANFSKLQGLRLLGRLLKINELADATYEKVHGAFKIEDQKLTFYDIEALHKSVQFTGSGSLYFDGRMDLDIMFAIEPELADRIPEEYQPSFGKRPDGYRTIVFKLAGDINNPRTNLDEKLAGQSSLLLSHK
ncbi:MAG: AsmA-like C-terminal region-containing protein [Verrucomicrobiota bacterium]